MRTTHIQFDIGAIQASWQAFDTTAHLRPIHTEDDYVHTVALMNSLLDATGDDEEHPLSGLLDLAGELVSKYEQEHYAIEQADIVQQSNLSAILGGKRKISATLARTPNVKVMKFIIAIEPGTKTTTFGVVVPDLPGCFSAGDTLDKAVNNAREAIELWCQTVIEDGGGVPMAKTLAEHQSDPDFAGWTWAVVEVPVERYFGPAELNIPPATTKL